jgi:collagen type III alpha
MTHRNRQRVAFILGLAASAGLALAQSDAQPRRPARTPEPIQPEGDRPARPARPPGDRPGQGAGARGDGGALLHALDRDRDGALSADEINRAATSLKSLDADGDGRITREEMREYAAQHVRPAAEPPRAPEGERRRPGEGQPPPRPRDPDAGPREGQRPSPPAEPGDAARRPRLGDAGAILAALDADRDGVLSAQELANASTVLRSLDSDNDGKVSAEELRRAGLRNAARMLFNDANGDGRITRDEVPERMRERFDDWDTNGDGHLDKAEQEAVVERMRQRRPDGPPRRGDPDAPPPDRT